MDLFVYIISDADGMDILHLSRNIMDRFEIKYKEKSFLNISNYEILCKAFADIKNDCGYKIIFSSLNHPNHDSALRNFGQKEKILLIDCTNYTISKISEYLGIIPSDDKEVENSKIIHHIKRMEAIDFAIKYDDGQDFNGIKYCDICLIRVSRSSKTPLSVYLASIGYKVSNIPILLQSRVPSELFSIDNRKIFGLTIDKHRLQQIREERLKSINLPKDSKYCDIKYIEEELDFAKEIMKDLDCKIIDVTNKSIEETSDFIISNIENINK